MRVLFIAKEDHVYLSYVITNFIASVLLSSNILFLCKKLRWTGSIGLTADPTASGVRMEKVQGDKKGRERWSEERATEKEREGEGS